MEPPTSLLWLGKLGDFSTGVRSGRQEPGISTLPLPTFCRALDALCALCPGDQPLMWDFLGCPLIVPSVHESICSSPDLLVVGCLFPLMNDLRLSIYKVPPKPVGFPSNGDHLGMVAGITDHHLWT